MEFKEGMNLQKEIEDNYKEWRLEKGGTIGLIRDKDGNKVYRYRKTKGEYDGILIVKDEIVKKVINLYQYDGSFIRLENAVAVCGYSEIVLVDLNTLEFKKKYK